MAYSEAELQREIRAIKLKKARGEQLTSKEYAILHYGQQRCPSVRIKKYS